MDEPRFRETAAGYDATVGEMTRRIVPALLRAARIGPGTRVLDMATGLAVGFAGLAGVVGHRWSDGGT